MVRNKRRSLGDLRENLNWILKYSEVVDRYLMYFNNDYEDFLENVMFQDCCLAKIGQIAECLNRIDKNHSDIYDVYFVSVVGMFHGMRDITIHQYENIDFHIIWTFLTEERHFIVGAARKCLDDLESLSEDDGVVRTSSKKSLFRWRW